MKANSSLDLFPGDRGYVPPPLDSHDNISLALAQLYTALWAEKIDHKQARLSLQIISLAQRTLKTKAQEAANAAKAAARKEQITKLVSPKPTTAASQAPPTKPPQPAYKGDRYYDPYGCMPKE